MPPQELKKNKDTAITDGVKLSFKVDRATHDILTELVESCQKKSQKELFLAMLSNYQNLRFELNEDESAIMKKAQELAPVTFRKRMKRMALRYAEQVINLKNKPEAPVDIKVKNSTKAADRRAEILLKQMFDHNNNAVNWYDKILLTKSSMLDYLEKQKDSNPEAIGMGKLVLDRCIEHNKKLIERHHETHKLTSNHNAIAHYERLKATKAGNL